jgi:hypothetical protein
LGKQQLQWNKKDQEAYHIEDSQSRLREPPGAVGRYSRSSYQDDDGKKEGGKSTATCMPEFQMVNNFQGRFWSRDALSAHKFSKSKIKILLLL